ncbi:MAG: hypothetical protein HY863_16610 [Chloroflexi bacterium]|nr:hypothetical protein [Chloroflexota bacterium]
MTPKLIISCRNVAENILLFNPYDWFLANSGLTYACNGAEQSFPGNGSSLQK